MSIYFKFLYKNFIWKIRIFDLPADTDDKYFILFLFAHSAEMRLQNVGSP
jgi:hypothetical protein